MKLQKKIPGILTTIELDIMSTVVLSSFPSLS